MATENTNTSLKYEDIISKSVLIQSGPPAVYQLRPKIENIGSLRRMTLGERNVKRMNKTILLVGETGTGKSTLVNALVNYAMGVKWEDDVWFHIVEEEERIQTHSKTSDVMVYQIFGFEGETLPYSLTIIDTPGYGDTRGIKQDAIVSFKLLDWFRSEDGVHDINAVGLVLKASVNHLDERQRYVFDSVVSLFGKDMEKNIVALITFSDGLIPENALKALEEANMKYARNEKNQPVYFLFNNCQNTERTQENKSVLETAWETSMGGMNKFADFLEKSDAQSVIKTIKVLKARIRLTACIQNLKERVESTEQKQRENQQTQEALKKHEEEMKRNEEFTVEVDEIYKEKENIKGGGMRGFFFNGAVCCKVCEETCHYPCTLTWSPGRCEVMKDGRCTVCTRKCPVSDHVKEKWRFVNKTRKVQKTLRDVKEKYERGKAGCEETTSLLENLEKQIEELQTEKEQWLNQSFEFVVKLDQIALTNDSPSNHDHLDFLIEKMKEKGDAEKVQKLEEMKLKDDKGPRAAPQYKLTVAVKAATESKK
ncbi:uncharacterized protein LOC119914856 [Micropterus salmoides]|uniref:uncharacterized protein LOC119914856 n=1 Tax=Micropterus salmoides TaxID=27706 RepID=UPI0018EA8E28|nr:uncharacterized protein LOC119914856 [Micropterus salmoides]